MKEKQKKPDMHKNYIDFGIFQAYHLIDELTVYENIETPLLYKGVGGSRWKYGSQLLDRFNMVAKKDLFPDAQWWTAARGGIARAIVGQPKAAPRR